MFIVQVRRQSSLCDRFISTQYGKILGLASKSMSKFLLFVERIKFKSIAQYDIFLMLKMPMPKCNPRQLIYGQIQSIVNDNWIMLIHIQCKINFNQKSPIRLHRHCISFILMWSLLTATKSYQFAAIFIHSFVAISEWVVLRSDAINHSNRLHIIVS